ncbi:MAG: CoB--CoM heterodisulfide reductase subunit B [Candidatus Bathyarchaeia archaeon]
MSKYAYFLGCITPNRYPGIELATRKVLENFGLKLLDMNGASCCPAPGVFGSFDLWTWLVIAARNLSIAEEMNSDVVVTCNGCYATLQEAHHFLTRNNELKEKVNGILKDIGREYKGTAKVKHVVEILEQDIGYKTILNRARNPLKGIKVAVHYGCHFLKPREIRQHGTSERPTMLDDFVMILGAESVNYKDKMMCCGAGGGVRAGKPDVALDFTKEKVENMINAGADCVVTPCAFCHLQFDNGQVQLTKKLGRKYELPVIFITQLLGLALGMSLEEVGLHKNQTQIRSFTRKLEVLS